jgi:uncharacterized protein (TIGR02246 family)
VEHGFEQTAGALSNAVARGDAAAAASLYADDGRLLTATARLISGRAAIEAYWRAGIALGLTGVALDPAEVEVVGGVAIEVGGYIVTARGGGSDEGKYLALHRRQADGSWRRAVDVFNPSQR